MAHRCALRCGRNRYEACRWARASAICLAACRRLALRELLLLSSTNPASFDSRYFGPILASDVIGSAQPLGCAMSTPPIVQKSCRRRATRAALALPVWQRRAHRARLAAGRSREDKRGGEDGG